MATSTAECKPPTPVDYNLHLESTIDSGGKVELQARLWWRACPYPQFRPDLSRDCAQIPKILAVPLRECIQGERPWPLFVFGPAGTGKTRAALVACDWTWGTHKFYDFAELCELAKTAKFDVQSSAFMVWRDWGKWTLAVIDDVGTRGIVTDHGYETLKSALDRREGRPLIVISNHNLGELANLFDDRVASRLAMGTVVEMVERDRRLMAAT